MCFTSFTNKHKRKTEHFLMKLRELQFLCMILGLLAKNEIYLQRLKHFLERLREYNIGINKGKSFLKADVITYCGTNLINTTFIKHKLKLRLY